MYRHKIREFTTERLDEVRNQWRGLAGEDEFEIELAPLFDWCNTHTAQNDGDSRAWELYNADTDRCDAIIEIVDSPRARLSKLLKLFLSPELWNIDDKRNQVVELYVAAYIEVIRTGILKGVKDVKLYGRTDLMLSILHTLHTHWPTKETGAEASIQGRWLTIKLTS